MMNKISILLFSLIAVLVFTSCEDEEEPFGSPYNLTVVGLETVTPETTHEYTIGDFTNPESYTWTVDGPAEIVGGNTGATISVKFNSVGDVKISVSNGVDTGSSTIEVAETEAAVTATLNGTGALKGGASDTVFFEFAAPVSEIAGFAMNMGDSTEFNRGEAPFKSGTLGDLVKVDDQHYYAIYTAGKGNGTSEAKFSGITSTAAYGSVVLDSVYAQLYRVDNIAPVANLSYSQNSANAGTAVTVTATFSEPVMPADPADTLLFVSLSGAGISEKDTLVATGNPLVYTFEYNVEEDANGPVQIELDDVADLAGNALAGVNNSNSLQIDNMKPVVVGSAVDAGSKATITIGSTEAGTGMYLILKDGADAPADAEEFMAAKGIVSRTVDLTDGNAKVLSEALAAGSYDVYYLAMDAAGNFSSIKTTSFVMN